MPACGVAHRSAFLDTTQAVIKPEPGHSIEAGGGSSAGVPRSRFPLQVRLLKKDRDGYRQMDRITYDVQLTNVSRQPLIIPWSPEVIHKRDRPASGYRHALFELILAKAGRQDFVANTFVLYGAPTVAGSLKELKPKESAVVRLWGVFSGSGFQDTSNPVLFPVPGLRLKVGLVMYAPGDSGFKYAHEEFSQNTLPITVLPPVPSDASQNERGAMIEGHR